MAGAPSVRRETNRSTGAQSAETGDHTAGRSAGDTSNASLGLGPIVARGPAAFAGRACLLHRPQCTRASRTIQPLQCGFTRLRCRATPRLSGHLGHARPPQRRQINYSRNIRTGLLFASCRRPGRQTLRRLHHAMPIVNEVGDLSARRVLAYYLEQPAFRYHT